MTRHTLTALGALVLGVAITISANPAHPSAASSDRRAGFSAHTPVATASATTSPMIEEYCLGCHDAAGKSGGLVLEAYDAEHPEKNIEVSEKVIRKLRAGLMPPVGEDRPDPATISAFVTSLETKIDKAAADHPNPGSRPFQRLNRVEYARSVHDLLAIDVDVDAFLPPDTVSHGFDNVADVESFSPALMEGYMRAAGKISREAVGDAKATPAVTTYKVPRTASQVQHVDGAPLGTRGGISVVHNFPADGDYVFKIQLHSTATGGLFGSTSKGEQIEVSINGARVALLDINPRMNESDANGMNMDTKPIAVKAGPQRVSAAFIQKAAAPVDDLIEPIEHTLADTIIGSSQGITTFPHLRDFGVSGPFKVTGISDTPSRHKIFTCHPATAADERPCATKIIADLASQAYRRPTGADDVSALMTFYDAGRKDADFESGVRTAIQAMLASPSFVFRMERTPANIKPGQTYRLSDIELASRLSYFLWATGPDKDLIAAASTNTLSKPGVIEQQVKRMLADPRADTLATRFAGQWLRLQDLEKMQPDALLYPHFDDTLARAMQRETELFFASIVREDRSVLDLLTADYTFVNERLAAHYNLPNVSGPNFQRVSLPDENRRGLLGEGSILTLTSVADRTSLVQRGKWVMEVLLGVPPPPPPPNVPLLEDTKGVVAGKLLTVRERMEEHRKNPACSSCHKLIDPIGLALENFDPTGAWRIKDSGAVIDAASKMYDGTPLTGPASLRQALLNHSDVFLRHFTEQMMTYAVGRRVEAYDMPAVRTVVRDAGANGNHMSSFILGIVQSAAFQMSRAEDDATSGAAKAAGSKTSGTSQSTGANPHAGGAPRER